MANDKWENCPYCGGTGRIEREDGEQDCSMCDGTGKIDSD